MFGVGPSRGRWHTNQSQSRTGSGRMKRAKNWVKVVCNLPICHSVVETLLGFRRVLTLRQSFMLRERCGGHKWATRSSSTMNPMMKFHSGWRQVTAAIVAQAPPGDREGSTSRSVQAPVDGAAAGPSSGAARDSRQVPARTSFGCGNAKNEQKTASFLLLQAPRDWEGRNDRGHRGSGRFGSRPLLFERSIAAV